MICRRLSCSQSKILQGTVVEQIIDMFSEFELLPRGGHEDQPAPTRAENGRLSLLQALQADLVIQVI